MNLGERTPPRQVSSLHTIAGLQHRAARLFLAANANAIQSMIYSSCLGSTIVVMYSRSLDRKRACMQCRWTQPPRFLGQRPVQVHSLCPRRLQDRLPRRVKRWAGNTRHMECAFLGYGRTAFRTAPSPTQLDSALLKCCKSRISWMLNGQ